MLKPNLQNTLVTRGLKLSHLRMMAAFAATRHLGQAAQALGITQPAASRLLGEIERICGYRVHVRAGRGMALTEVGQALAQRADRILTELRDTAREIDAFGKGALGQVAIGAVTAPALDIVLPALRAARLEHPHIQIDVSVASSDVLFDQLMTGRLDFIIARIPQNIDPALVTALQIAPEPVKFVVRRDHPLLGRAVLTWEDLAQYDWVLPLRGNPMADAVLARFAQLGQGAPASHMTTSSFLLTMAQLQQSQSIAPLSSAVAAQFAQGLDSSLAVLPIETGISVRPYSILQRRAGALPLAARHILAIIHKVMSQD